MYAIVCLLAILCPFAIIGLILQVYHYFDRVDGLNQEIDKLDQHVAALEECNDGLMHTLQDRERDHTAAELDLDAAEADLLECEGELMETEEKMEKVVQQNSILNHALDEHLIIIDDLESTILDLRVNAAGQKPVKAKRIRKAS